MSQPQTIEDVLKETKIRMDKTIEAFRAELSKVRTGRASTALVDDIKVDVYGALTPLKQIASISVPEAKTIAIQPWDPTLIPAIEKAIRQSELGINPSNDGRIIRLVMPLVTEERRRELVKFVSKIAEEYRVAVRNIRRDANSMLKDLEKAQHLSEDEVKKTQGKIQNITDDYIKKVNELFSAKEKEILEV